VPPSNPASIPAISKRSPNPCPCPYPCQCGRLATSRRQKTPMQLAETPEARERRSKIKFRESRALSRGKYGKIVRVMKTDERREITAAVCATRRKIGLSRFAYSRLWLPCIHNSSICCSATFVTLRDGVWCVSGSSVRTHKAVDWLKDASE
jgi:hypothetical protein